MKILKNYYIYPTTFCVNDICIKGEIILYLYNIISNGINIPILLK